jgi:hypothetical protein
MKRNDAIEISNLAGNMLLEVERELCSRLGLHYPLGDDLRFLPSGQQHMLESVRTFRAQLAAKVKTLIED